MKKHSLLIFILLLHFLPLKAQYVNIPDPNLVVKLTQLYPSCMNGNQMDTTCAQIVNEDTLDVYGLFLNDISGIEYFDNLKSLNCFFNQLTFLPALPSTLQTLSCENNELTNLPALPITLEKLFCSNNFLNSLPALPNSLLDLRCDFNNLTSLLTLPNSLQKLQCNNNQLTNLPQLPDSLTDLACFDNLLTNLPILPNNLQILSCGNNDLTNLPLLPDSLKEFNCSHNFLTNLPALPPLLTKLICSFNQISSLPELPNSLDNLVFESNSISSIPSLPNTLSKLFCYGNLLTSLPALPDSLSELDCRINQITSLPKLPEVMYRFFIANNDISCLNNLPQVINTGLTFIDISNNPFSCVPNQTTYTLGLPLCLENDTINNPNNCLSAANISGFVFTDQNNNCMYNSSDIESENIPVKLFDATNTFVAQNYLVNGTYGFTVEQPGAYTVKLQSSNLPITMACLQADSQIVNLISLTDGISNVNFPIECIQTNDLEILSANTYGWVFPGQIHSINLNITNEQTWYNLNCGASSIPGTVTIEISGQVTYVSTALGALTPQINGNIFTYTISNFNTLTPSSFGLNLLVDTTAQVNDLICVHAEINPTILDADTTNNSYNLCYNVVNSYDPNMKEVYPVNVIPGYDDWFTYTIHFQNTGNAPAFNIRLRDTLDLNLDLSSFEIMGYSHPASVTLTGNILTVRFNSILLPDSTSDYEGSMGYFQYRIKPFPNLPNGTQIENTAYIYFDYNAPIITNTTQNNFDITAGKIEQIAFKNEFIIYPNPSNGIFNFKDTKNLKQVEVYNLLGEQILSQGNQKQINLSGFAKGIYYAKINGEVVVKLVKD